MSARTLLLGGALLATAALTTLPALAQDRTSACRNEVDRFASTLLDPQPQQLPGARQGAQLEGEEEKRIRNLLDEARSAARSGDADGCVERLREARNMARESGVGGGARGSRGVGDRQGSTGQGNTGSSASTPGLNPGSPMGTSTAPGGGVGSMGTGSTGGTGLGGGTGGSGTGTGSGGSGGSGGS